MNPKNIRKELARLNIVFNEDSVLVLTKRHVPIYVKVIASLGRSFNHCMPLNFRSAVNSMISMDRILNHCDNYADWFHARHSFNVLKVAIVGSGDHDNLTEAQRYLRWLGTLTLKFFRNKQNCNIFVVQADKGGKTVIMDSEDYNAKAIEHIEMNIALGNYVEVNVDFFTELQPAVEGQYFKIVSEVNPFLIIDLKRDLNDFKLEEDHDLCSFDYESMFTNIDVDETTTIILDLYYLIAATTSVPCSTFMRCLRFYTKDAAYFGALGHIFVQCRGLAMGNRLSQAMAEVRTNHALLRSIITVDASIISFIYKYVDDIFSSIHRDYVLLVRDAISTATKMVITVSTIVK